MAEKTDNRRRPVEAASAPIYSQSASASTMGPVPTGLIPLDDAAADRLKRIGEAAYKRAQQRNFAAGHDLEDWLEAEKEIDAQARSSPASK
jgi:Protein of unknown function (DUF2934)